MFVLSYNKLFGGFEQRKQDLYFITQNILAIDLTLETSLQFRLDDKVFDLVSRFSLAWGKKMNKENDASKFERPLVRVTRAQAKALGTRSGMVQPVKPFQDQKRVLRMKSKRSEMEENRSSNTTISILQHKRRGVLRDVTNNALKDQVKI